MPLLPRRRKLRKSLTTLRRTWRNTKPFLNRRGRSSQRNGKQKARHLKKRRNLKKLRLPASRQKSRYLKPGFAIFSRELSSFRSWGRKWKNWSGSGSWTKRITSISRHRSKRRGSTRLWTPPKCPTLAPSSGPPLPCWRPKRVIRLPWDWPAVG